MPMFGQVTGIIAREVKVTTTDQSGNKGFIHFSIQTPKGWIKKDDKPFEWWDVELYSGNLKDIIGWFKPGKVVTFSGYMEKNSYKTRDGQTRQVSRLKVFRNGWHFPPRPKSMPGNNTNTNTGGYNQNNQLPPNTNQQQPQAQPGQQNNGFPVQTPMNNSPQGNQSQGQGNPPPNPASQGPGNW